MTMTSNGLCCALVVLILQSCTVYGQEEIIKGSLTFIIDDTGSMHNEIRQVKEEVKIIFEKVLSSNTSQIENFVLVTFNDPTAKLRTITKDRNEFKRALEAIRVDGGGDCPEHAMKGIELGLTESLPLSYLYVFTDASAKDYASFEAIKSISQRKQSQVVFILTGLCNSKESADYQVYHKMAEATGGQVFHMMKDDVKDILKYIEESITGRGVMLVNKKLPEGYGKKITYPVDPYTKEVLISVTGTNPRIGDVTGPGGSKPTTEHIVSGKGEMAIVKVKNAKPGDHEVEVGSSSETHAVITAKSDLNFQLGFSIDRPNSMKDTVTRPAPEGTAFLGIRLLGNGVKLTTAKILDLSDTVVTELPLELLDEKSQFYVTPSFNPPFTMFRVSVIGKDLRTETPIERTGPTPIARQNPSAEKKKNTAPVITIEGGPKIIMEYDAPLKLKCNVHGYPAPDIVWEEKDTGIRMPAKVQLVEVPYDYVGILDIDKANKNITYQCKASNIVGTTIKYVQVETERKIYLDVIEVPKDTRVEYNKEGTLVCKVDAYPPASITWYKDGAVISGISNIDISSDSSILTIQHMQLDLQGTYTCEARNDLDRKVFIANVVIFGVEEPVIDKSHEEIRVTEKTNAALSCRILEGIPKPTVSWSFRPAGMDTFRVMKETSETVHLYNVRKDQIGSYKCNVENVLGSDRFTMELVVEYGPKIKEDVKLIQTKDDDEVRISCDVTGEPIPAVKWFFNGTRLDSTAKTRVSSDNSLRFKARLADIGSYRCEAVNKLGLAKKSTFLHVFVPVTIETPKKSTIEAMVGKSTILYCRADGYPKPNIKWTFQSSDPKIPVKDITPTGGVASVALRNMQLDQQGLYTCEAGNGIGGSAHITYDVKVYDGPKIKEDVKLIQTKDDDEVRISCDVTGEPIPAVKWFFNGTRLDSTAKTRVSSDNSLRFKARLADTGSYRCEAVNKLGLAKKTTFLHVFVPVAIATPKKSTIEAMVGKSTILYCRADGYPKPNIKWTFQSSDPKIPVKDITPTGGVASVALRNMQLDQQGLYTCEAGNGIGGSAHITYDVKVYAPPVIKNVYPAKTFEAVEGDLTVRIQCKATGSPKPTIVWMKNDLNLAIGSEWYEMEDDGTLIIKNIDRESKGTYVCRAENILGNDTEVYEVIVRDNLVPEIPTNTVYVEEGKTIDIKCDIPHTSTDQMRWYKGGVPIAIEELTLYSVTRSDDGLYTCRVSNPTKSRSVTTKVVIGFKPVFTTEEEETVEFVFGADSEMLSCEAYGQPRPKSAIWKHNGKELSTTAMSHPLGMVYDATGTYECEVSNEFGSIHRTFKVTSRDCILNIQKGFPEKQPIMTSKSLEWPVFAVNEGYMIIPHAHYFYLICPSRFSNSDLSSQSTVTAYCERDSTIKINGITYNFTDIQCNEEVKPQVSETGIACLPGNTEYVKIGYRVIYKFLGVYDVCLDKENNVPLFTKHRLSPDHTDRSTVAEWSNSFLPQDFDTLYDCRRQLYDISTSLGRGLRTRESCCFGKRQLVSSHNLLPGVPTSSAYEYLNVVPHWSTCNSKNWEDVEQSVRNLVKSAGRDLTVTTGTHHSGPSTDMTLHDSRGGNQTVAPYLWKVVQDPAQSASLAIIHINIPELSPEEASKYVLCPDICANGITWIEPSNWHNVEDGYTYCCAITEFEKAFGYNRRFSPDMVYVLFDGSLIPDFYLTKK